MKKIIYRFINGINERLDGIKPQLSNSNFQFSKPNFQIAIFILLIAFSACSSEEGHEHQEQAEATTYTCPMHPQVVQEEPGSCPVCGMDLVRQSVEGGEIEVTDDLSLLLEPANVMVVSNIRTVNPVEEQKTIVSSFPGVVAYDTRHTYSLPIRFGGRIEKLYVNYNFQQVEKGQKLLEIYSPELLTAQRELLFLLDSDPGNERLIEAAQQKLRLLGVSEAQLSQLTRSRKEQYSFPVYSPYTGYIAEAPVLEAEGRRNTSTGGGMSSGMGGSMRSGGMSAGGGGGMSGSSIRQSRSSELSIREGMYVEPGQSLFRIIDASRLWAEFNVAAAEASLVEEGDPLQISWGPGKQQQLQAQVDLVQPFFSAGENFSKIRTYLQNNQLKVGQLVEGTVNTQTPPALWIPALAVLDIGTRKMVFVKKEGVLRPKEIITGTRAGAMVEVVEGLSTADAIAHNAQFLIDSEGIVRLENEEM